MLRMTTRMLFIITLLCRLGFLLLLLLLFLHSFPVFHRRINHGLHAEDVVVCRRVGEEGKSIFVLLFSPTNGCNPLPNNQQNNIIAKQASAPRLLVYDREHGSKIADRVLFC